jgi:hypothetical protein
MADEPRRFVDDQQFIVFIDDIEHKKNLHEAA